MANNNPPAPLQLAAIRAAGHERAFSMPSDERVGHLLRSLVTAKANGRFLELGTGLGLSLAWMLDGMDRGSSILSLDNEPDYVQFAGELFQSDKRVNVICADGGEWLDRYSGPGFDLIFADTWPGKYHHLEAALSLLNPGGMYVIDDMLPQENWPEGHAAKAEKLAAELSGRSDLHTSWLEWSTGVMLAVKSA